MGPHSFVCGIVGLITIDILGRKFKDAPTKRSTKLSTILTFGVAAAELTSSVLTLAQRYL